MNNERVLKNRAPALLDYCTDIEFGYVSSAVPTHISTQKFIATARDKSEVPELCFSMRHSTSHNRVLSQFQDCSLTFWYRNCLCVFVVSSVFSLNARLHMCFFPLTNEQKDIVSFIYGIHFCYSIQAVTTTMY